MELRSTKETIESDNIWVIARTGFNVPIDTERYPEIQADSVNEYVISDFAKYMLDPNPIEIQKRLIGCKIYSVQPYENSIRSKILKWIPGKKKTKEKEKLPSNVIMAENQIVSPSQKDKHFVAHIDMINESLRPYDFLPKALSSLDVDKISDITGICGDIDGNHSTLHIEGDIPAKIEYMKTFFSRNVNVILDKRQVSHGLFEMRGFDFTSFNPNHQYRLIRFFSNKESKACVIGPDHKVEYWIEDINLIKFMLLLDQSIKENDKFRDAFRQCITGKMIPLKILFNTKFEIDYTDSYLPEVYQDVFKTYNLGIDEKDVVMESLNQLQLGIAFSYIRSNDSGKQKLFTHISVLHNVRALEPIRQQLPRLYSEINKRISVSDPGRFYLLDSIRGYIYA